MHGHVAIIIIKQFISIDRKVNAEVEHENKEVRNWLPYCYYYICFVPFFVECFFLSQNGRLWQT